MTRRFAALCLDLDQTLLDSSGVGEAVRRTCERLAPELGLDGAALLAANGEAWRELWPEVQQAWNLGTMSGEAIGLEAWQRTLRRVGVDDPAVARRARAHQLEGERTTLRLFDDARALMQSLPLELPLALITNGASDTQRFKLEVVGLSDRFGAVVVSGEAGIAKPDPQVFHRALAPLGVAPGRALHVGDNLRTDVAGARAAGLTAVWLNRGGRPRADDLPEPDHELTSLAELPALL